MRYLLDTNICIYLIKKKPENVLQKFLTQPIGEIGISAISVAELQFGVHKSQYPAKNQYALEQFLIPLVIVEFNYLAAVNYGRIQAILEQQGTPIGSLDLLIAAQTLTLDVTLVTNNIKEFSRVPELKVANWVNS